MDVGAGGDDLRGLVEIRNIIAERVLGLPRGR
jgi:hypothetical protein